MTKKEKELAIKLFKDQLESLMKITFDQQEVWASETMDLIKQYISPTSQHLKTFGVFEPIMGEYLLPENRKIGKDIIENCLNKIENTPTTEPFKPNWFARLSETWATTLIVFSLGTVASVSYLLGSQHGSKQHDFEVYKINKENDSLGIVIRSYKELLFRKLDSTNKTDTSIKPKK